MELDKENNKLSSKPSVPPLEIPNDPYKINFSYQGEISVQEEKFRICGLEKEKITEPDLPSSPNDYVRIR